MTRKDVEFRSDDVVLRGWLYRPDGDDSAVLPAIVMAHGFAAIKEQYLDRYAEVFARAGFAVLVYDHRNFGGSDGAPRQEVDPVLQRRGYRDAITWLMLQPGIDPSRIGIWGTSYSGGHVLEVAAIDRRVACVVAQVPTTNGFAAAQRRTRSDHVPSLIERFNADRLLRYQGQAPAMLPVTSKDPSVACALAGEEGYQFFEEAMKVAPQWINQVTLRSGEMARENEPGQFVARISPTPLLLIVSAADVLTPTDMCLAAYQAALPPKHLVMVPGGHFKPYVEYFDLTSKAAMDWFSQHLKP